MRFFILAVVAISFAAVIDATDTSTVAPVTPSFLGTYKLTNSTLFEEYMEAVGVGWFLRKLAATATPTTIISKNGDDWSIHTETTFKTTNINFKLGQEFDELTADGRSCKATITQDGENKLVHTQRCDGSEMHILRTFHGTVMTMTLPFPTGDNRVCIRNYLKL